MISLRRRDPRTGRTFYAVVNLSPQRIEDYRFGVETGGLRLRIAGSGARFGGDGELERALGPGGRIPVEGHGMHEKPLTARLPVLAPYEVAVFSTLEE